MSCRGKRRFLSHTHPALSYSDCLTEVTACNLLTGLEVPLVISHKEAFDGYLDAIIGEIFFFFSVHVYAHHYHCDSETIQFRRIESTKNYRFNLF